MLISTFPLPMLITKIFFVSPLPTFYLTLLCGGVPKASSGTWRFSVAAVF